MNYACRTVKYYINHLLFLVWWNPCCTSWSENAGSSGESSTTMKNWESNIDHMCLVAKPYLQDSQKYYSRIKHPFQSNHFNCQNVAENRHFTRLDHIYNGTYLFCSASQMIKQHFHSTPFWGPKGNNFKHVWHSLNNSGTISCCFWPVWPQRGGHSRGSV